MTREEAGKLAVIAKAYADGKEIEVYDDEDKKWVSIDEPSFDCHVDRYRIKQEPTYRPFKDANECWNEMLKHHPFSWLANIKYKYRVASRHIADNAITLSNGSSHKFSEVFDEYTFVDGTPFGTKVEEDES